MRPFGQHDAVLALVERDFAYWALSPRCLDPGSRADRDLTCTRVFSTISATSSGSPEVGDPLRPKHHQWPFRKSVATVSLSDDHAHLEPLLFDDILKAPATSASAMGQTSAGRTTHEYLVLGGSALTSAPVLLR